MGYRPQSKLKPSKLIIVLDDGDIDFSWYPEEIEEVLRRFKAGYTLNMLSRAMKRKSDEVLLLLLHLRRAKKIQFQVNVLPY